MEPYLTSSTNIYSEGTNTERLNAVGDLFPGRGPRRAPCLRDAVQDGSFFFLIARQALFVNQKHKADLNVWKTKDGPCVSFPPARPTAGRLQAEEDRKKAEEEEEVGGEVEKEGGRHSLC